MSLLHVLIAGLAGWRLASMLVGETGPWHIFERVRDRVAAEPGHPEGFWGELLSCIWCTSVWTSTAAWLLYYLSPQAVSLVAVWAVAMIVEGIVRGRDTP